MGPTVVGGKLKLKGAASSSSSGHEMKRKAAAKTELVPSSIASSGNAPANALTEAERKFKEKRKVVEERQIKKLVKVTYREKIDSFNSKLASMTEHNDIPRISAAGNG